MANKQFAFCKKSKNEEVFEEEKIYKTTLLDNISLMTEHSKMSQIIDSGGYFWAEFKYTLARNGKTLYGNISRIFFSDVNLPTSSIASDGTGRATKMCKLDINNVFPLMRYLTYHPDTFYVAYQLNTVSDGVSDEVIYKLAESLMPKKKLFIKNIVRGLKAVKGEYNDELVELSMDFFSCSEPKAIEHIKLIELTGKLKELKEMFGLVEDKKSKKGAKK